VWFWLRPRTATGGVRAVLVPLVHNRVLTTAARRAGVPSSIA
jgi:hypothetical protein